MANSGEVEATSVEIKLRFQVMSQTSSVPGSTFGPHHVALIYLFFSLTKP